MGLGGDLLWTPVLRKLAERNGQPVSLYSRPHLTDLLKIKLNDSAINRKNSAVFALNPDCRPFVRTEKSSFTRALDRHFDSFIDVVRLRSTIDDMLYKYSQIKRFNKLYLDLPHHSYAQADLPDRFVWKKPGHIIDILAHSVGLHDVPHQCLLYYDDEDEAEADAFVTKHDLDSFLTIEPWTNTEYFGNLRAWPFERWQKIVQLVMENFSSLKVVQLGSGGREILKGAVDASGKLSFRASAILIKKSVMFLGTEGGLMHAANAVGANALILYSGVNSPSFSGYPEMHRIIHFPVDCMNCGYKRNCPTGHICVLSIDIDWVWNELVRCLKSNGRLVGIQSGHD